jgi:hypothetical protein
VLVLIPIQFCFDDVDIAALVEGEGVNRADTRRKLTADDQQLQTLAELVNGQTLGICGEVTLKRFLIFQRLPFKSLGPSCRARLAAFVTSSTSQWSF